MKNLRIAKDGDRVLISFEGDEKAAKDIIDYIQSKVFEGSDTAKVESAGLAPVEKKAPLPDPEGFGEAVPVKEREFPPTPVMKRRLLRYFEEQQIPRAKYSRDLKNMSEKEMKELFAKVS